MIRRPPRSTQGRSSAASDVYKRQGIELAGPRRRVEIRAGVIGQGLLEAGDGVVDLPPVSYTHLRAHETVLDLVCRLLLEKKKRETDTQNHNKTQQSNVTITSTQ